ncbi:MAG: ABC transporter ATP-binding protein [Lachnospiraceae bacterium]|nr:ABC transporter ATP-binding protein [Lachnospiraceae bacterium]
MDIFINDISKIYGSGESQVTALSHASMTIHAGDFISIMGPSGSGKSTLLHIISGLDTPSMGQVLYGDTDIHTGSDKKLSAFRRQNIGFIFQQFHLLPVLSTRENIIMPLLLDKKQPEESYFQEITALLGLTGRLNHLPHELSGGQQQRVAIARSLIAKPDILFADEPTGNLDSKNGSEVMKLLCSIHENLHQTLVVITHDPHIAKMAERRFTIVDGILSEVMAK